MTKAWEKLEGRGCWHLDPKDGGVREYADVVAEAKRSKEEIHIGRVFGFVVVKNSEQSEDKQKT